MRYAMFSIYHSKILSDSEQETHHMVTRVQEEIRNRHHIVTEFQEEIRNRICMVTGPQEKIHNRHHMVTGVREEIPYCFPGTSSWKQKKARSTSQQQFRCENTLATIEADQILLPL